MAEITHQCPPDGETVTPCCGQDPLDLPRDDRMTGDGPVTCRGRCRCKSLAWPVRCTRLADGDDGLCRGCREWDASLRGRTAAVSRD